MALMSKTNGVLKKIRMLVLTASILFVFASIQIFAQTPRADSGDDLASAVKLIQENRFQDALAKLNVLAQKNPSDSQAWFYLGVASIELRFLKTGTDALRKSIELDPGFGPAHTSLADALLQSGALAQAIGEAQKALTLNPNDERAHYALAFASFRQTSMDEAVRYAELAISDKLDFAPAYLLKAQALIGLYKPSAPSIDEPSKEKVLTRYQSAAYALDQYVQLIPESEDRTIWAKEGELLKNFSFNDKSVRTAKDAEVRARVISKPEPTYTEEARKYRVTGQVILKATFAFDGTVKDVLVV